MSDFDFGKIRRLDGGLLLVFRELLLRRRAGEVAERLGLTPSAVSHALVRLRDLFEDPLFIRRPHGMEPTRRALELGPRIDALLALTSTTLGRESGFDPATSTRQFRLAAPEFVTALIGGRLVEMLRAEAPGVIFTVQFPTQDAAQEGLRRGDIDLALGRFGEIRPGLAAELLFEDRYCVVARQGHPVIGPGLSFEAYRDTGHILAQAVSDTAGDRRAEEMAVMAVVPQWLTALVMVASSDGIATVPRRLAERHAERLGLQVLDPPFTPYRLEVSAVRRADAPDAGVDWLLDRIRQAAG
ncbi:LysR family transcriptional regulator [Phenylobacterium aquaticum]|uniref:LysR family transcriptional regulator n=1 Tax=Phenylobacterium aquaticum TaxID=1763816 RepID=UPI001F5E254F|nr:LysR family transcriptional regulator [Phenylobacterium aquaticum]MCI3131777.1 LysR family transcriptional regulator [Phenylobacterium aquaticum]